MECRLDGQVALVTGASSGLGEAIARLFAGAGAAVVVNYHSGAGRAADLVRRIEEDGGRAVAIGGDVADEAAVERLFDGAVAAFGAVDILVANSGLQKDAPIGSMALSDWQKVIDVNLTGQFLCARAAIRRFRAQGDRGVSRAIGKILCMSSVHETIPWAGHVNYAASKGGVALLMRSLAQEVAGERIRVNGLAPGAIRTPINEKATTGAAEEKLLGLIPYGRVGEPLDVARAALFLASDMADYLVGATLTVDGGMTLYPAFRDNG
ncbi:glucose 1-dehydrogenase [Azospirillum agricola]|uniref:glucose 1-dehydrogenase n=1 Tax=Azospirillum agricola TaxID=1720247 RepID=UPI000A0EFAE5|nr:glucose 1-dehydrogenase [Azospirillum agricola]SMH31708.1 glucose 1-dehydrogenase [Azospirillum lipoferum]